LESGKSSPGGKLISFWFFISPYLCQTLSSVIGNVLVSDWNMMATEGCRSVAHSVNEDKWQCTVSH